MKYSKVQAWPYCGANEIFGFSSLGLKCGEYEIFKNSGLAILRFILTFKIFEFGLIAVQIGFALLPCTSVAFKIFFDDVLKKLPAPQRLLGHRRVLVVESVGLRFLNWLDLFDFDDTGHFVPTAFHS